MECFAAHHLLLVSALLLSGCGVSDAFSKGSLLVSGNSAARRMYCHRPVLHRPPVHVESSCGGICAPRDGAEHYAIDLHVNDTTYWINGFDLTVRALQDTGLSVTGFSLVAVDDMGTVVGVFTGNDDDVIVGSCEGVLNNAVEGHYVVHAHAQHGRKNVTVTWTPDGYNHETVKFHAWIVHNHSSIFYLESQELSSKKHGSSTLDVDAIFQELMGNALASMNEFEQTFNDRQTLGYNIELDDPFQPFNEDPSQKDLVPGFGEVKPRDGLPGWVSSYSHMLNAIDRGGVFSWKDVMRPPKAGLGSLALAAILDDAAYDSGVIDVALGSVRDLGNGADEVPADSPKRVNGKSQLSNDTNRDQNDASTSKNLNRDGADQFGNVGLSLHNMTNDLFDNISQDGFRVRTENQPGASNVSENLEITKEFSNISADTEQTKIDSDSNNDLRNSSEVDTVAVNIENTFSSLRNFTEPEQNTSSIKAQNHSGSDMKRTSDNETFTLTSNITDKTLLTESLDSASLFDGFDASKSRIELLDFRANRVKRQSSQSSSRTATPPPWAMGPQMAMPSTNPRARRPQPNRPNIRTIPMPNRRPDGRSSGRNGDPFGRNPRMPPQFPGQMGQQPFGGQQNFGSPMNQQFPPGMRPQQFPGGRSNSPPFGGPGGAQRSQSPFGQPGQNPFGQQSQNPFGQQGQNPFGQPSQNPFGPPNQNPFGQPNNNPFAQPGQNPFGQPSQNSFGQPRQSPFGQSRQNPFGQEPPNPFGQQNQNPFGPQSQNPFGQERQNPFGQPNENPFGQPPQSAFGPPNQNPFGPVSSFPIPGGANGPQPNARGGLNPPSTSLIGRASQPDSSSQTDSDEGGELELKPSPFESFSFPLGPSGPSSFGSSASSEPSDPGRQNPFEAPRIPPQGQMNGQFGQPSGFPGSPNNMNPNQMTGGNPFAQQMNPFGGQFGGSSFPGSGFGQSQMPGQFGFQGNMPGMPPQMSQMGEIPGLPPSPFSQNSFGSQSGMPFMGGSQFGSGMNRFGGGRNSNSMFGYPSMGNPFSSMSSSPFGRPSSFSSPFNRFGSSMPGMRNPLSRGGSMSPFSSPFSSMRGGFPGMMDMRGLPGMPGSRSMGMGSPMGGFPTRSIGSRSRSRSRG